MTEQQVLALIAGEQRRLAHALMMEDSNAQGPMWEMSVMLKHTFPEPTAPPPAAESEEEVVERVARAIYVADGGTIAWDNLVEGCMEKYRRIARAAIAAVRGGGGE